MHHSSDILEVLKRLAAGKPVPAEACTLEAMGRLKESKDEVVESIVREVSLRG